MHAVIDLSLQFICNKNTTTGKNALWYRLPVVIINKIMCWKYRWGTRSCEIKSKPFGEATSIKAYALMLSNLFQSISVLLFLLYFPPTKKNFNMKKHFVIRSKLENWSSAQALSYNFSLAHKRMYMMVEIHWHFLLHSYM